MLFLEFLAGINSQKIFLDFPIMRVVFELMKFENEVVLETSEDRLNHLLHQVVRVEG